MIPRTYPTDANGYWMVFEITPTGLQPWVDYIPVEDKGGTSASPDTYNTGGAIKANVLLSVAGLTAWVDYTPVDLVTGEDWSSNDGGAIPIWTP